MKIIFLHIPKTAGQHIHAELIKMYGVDSVCPARVNEQLRLMPIKQINGYSVFSGHFDWSLLDCIKGPKYTFTILRDPIDRILSFYFYLRETAKKISIDDLNKPEKQGLKGALFLTPDEYFLGGSVSWKKFIDDHYDNFYTYYFAGRTYDARSQFQAALKSDLLDENKLLDLAINNLNQVDGIFSIKQVESALLEAGNYGGKVYECNHSEPKNANNKILPEHRASELRLLGASEEVFNKLSKMCQLDNIIFSRYLGNTSNLK